MTRTQTNDAPQASAAEAPHTAQHLQDQISDRPEPLPVWLAWVMLTFLVLGAAWAMYAYLVTQYVPE